MYACCKHIHEILLVCICIHARMYVCVFMCAELRMCSWVCVFSCVFGQIKAWHVCGAETGSMPCMAVCMCMYGCVYVYVCMRVGTKTQYDYDYLNNDYINHVNKHNQQDILMAATRYAYGCNKICLWLQQDMLMIATRYAYDCNKICL